MRIATVLAAAVLLVAGCSGDPVAAPPAAAPTTAAPTPATTRPPARTPAATTARPGRTPPPVTVDGPCPYADQATVMDIVGQHLNRSTVTRSRPHVGCAFYRLNGEKAADIAVSVLPTAAAAQAQAVRLAGRTANPVDTVGDGGAVAITADGALLAVSSGTALVVVRINQRISLEATEIAKLVVAKL